MEVYIAKCTQLCLMMVVTDPPVVMVIANLEQTEHRLTQILESVKDDIKLHSAGDCTSVVNNCDENKLTNETFNGAGRVDTENGTANNLKNNPMESSGGSLSEEIEKTLDNKPNYNTLNQVSNEALREESCTEHKLVAETDRSMPPSSKVMEKNYQPTEESDIGTRNQHNKSVNFQNRKQFERNMFKDYTEKGPYIDFTVWPALLLYKDGPVLCRGVAQGTGLESVGMDHNGTSSTWWIKTL